MYSHYFNFVSLGFITYPACVVDTTRHRLADEGGGSLRAATEGEPAGMNAEKGGGYRMGN